MRDARRFFMVARRLEELEIWQLADELRHKVYALSAAGPAVRDFRFRDQLRDAAGSMARNIAEGFGRYRHGEFAYFLSVARGSLFEVSDQLRDGVARKYWSSHAIEELIVLCKRTVAGVTRLIRYLKSHPDV